MNTIKTAVILAGGLGTRIKPIIPVLPKCMASVAGRPFIDYIIHYLVENNIKKFVFALGYGHQYIIDHINSHWTMLDCEYSIEDEPLGTGGAALLAGNRVSDPNFLLINGDTYFKVDLSSMFQFHLSNQAFMTIGLKMMENFDRYGSVEINNKQIITRFNEKKHVSHGLINAGIYMIQRDKLNELNLPEKFSFEKDVLEKYVFKSTIFGYTDSSYFIDIGIPNDYEKANKDFKEVNI